MSERELNYCQSIEQLNGELMLRSLVRYSFGGRVIINSRYRGQRQSVTIIKEIPKIIL